MTKYKNDENGPCGLETPAVDLYDVVDLSSALVFGTCRKPHQMNMLGELS
jgi:hypothetical protein